MLAKEKALKFSHYLKKLDYRSTLLQVFVALIAYSFVVGLCIMVVLSLFKMPQR